MINLIAAVDNKLGLATDKGIPWRIEADIKYFRDMTKEGLVVMGYRTYLEFKKPFHDKENFVVTRDSSPLKNGFTPVLDMDSFLNEHEDEKVWIIGGAKLFEQTLDLADQLYLTRIEADYNCTKFFPQFESNFSLYSQSKLQIEDATGFRFEVWKRK